MRDQKKPPRVAAFNLVAKRSIRRDQIRAEDYMRLDLRIACEDCSHFDPQAQRCTIGYNAANHRRAEQERTYQLGGRVAFCRFIELD
jgi:hypothetical protein